MGMFHHNYYIIYNQSDLQDELDEEASIAAQQLVAKMYTTLLTYNLELGDAVICELTGSTHLFLFYRTHPDNGDIWSGIKKAMLTKIGNGAFIIQWQEDGDNCSAIKESLYEVLNYFSITGIIYPTSDNTYKSTQVESIYQSNHLYDLFYFDSNGELSCGYVFDTNSYP